MSSPGWASEDRAGERGMSPGSGRGMRGRVAGMRSPKYTVLSHLGHLDAMAGEESGAEPRRAVPSRAVRPAPPGPRPLAPPPGGSGAGLPAERLPGSVRAARIGSARPPERQVHGRDPVLDKPSLLCSPSPKAQRMRVLRIPLSWGKNLKVAVKQQDLCCFYQLCAQSPPVHTQAAMPPCLNLGELALTHRTSRSHCHAPESM